MLKSTKTVPPSWLAGHARTGHVELDWVQAPAAQVVYRPIRTSGLAKLLVVCRGEVRISQLRRRVVVPPGHFTWLDADRAFELETSDSSDHLVVRLPRDMLTSRHPEADLREAVVRGEGGPGERILAGLLTGLARAGSELRASELPAAVDAVVAAVGIGPQRVADDARLVRLARALRYIHAHLGDRDLDATRVANAQGISRRYLDDLFKHHRHDSVASTIRRLRLERCAEELVSRPKDAAISIGQRWGFADPSHFTRAFKRHYGVPPAAYRSRSQ